MRFRVACALLFILPLGAEPLRVGRAAIKITPPAGIPMAGYYSIRLAEGTHDDLFAKALVLESGETRVALVACDLVNLDDALVASAREAVREATGITPARVMISATHSHTGPLLSRRFLATAPAAPRKLAEQYRAALPQRIAEAVRMAAQSLTPARAWTATGREESLSFYRRFLMKDGTVRFNPGKMNPDIVQPMGSIDPDVALAYFDAPDARPLSAYVNFALHLDTVGGTQFSADYAYSVSRLLAKLKGPDMLTLFTIGAAGNINHIDVSHKHPQKGHLEAQRIGTVLAGEVLKTIAKL
ncbi:MAG: neutral/alkaline non-lysosomal ceramidase N-terminal domain-containing protein, partial [Acidobacteriia bacterium]|nr:neutral/alkaline non-lysosomal ceramidase N-terminal domain-containing protein [Terriglobia bacterium]